jgi:hypothetical protein
LSAPEINQTTCLLRRFKMQVSKLIVALTVAAGFTSASFAQGTTAPAPQAAPAAKVTTPAPAAAEKKVEAPKAAEPVKTEAAKPEAVKAKGHDAKQVKHEKHDKTEVKPETKPAAQAPVSK